MINTSHRADYVGDAIEGASPHRHKESEAPAAIKQPKPAAIERSRRDAK